MALDSKAITKINNVMASMASYLIDGTLINRIKGFFVNSEDCRLIMPVKDIDAVGFREVHDAVKKVITEESGNIHVLHSASYRTYEEKTDVAWGNWNTYSYKKERESSIVFQFVRLTVEFVLDDGRWKIRKLFILPLLTMDPWHSTKGLRPVNFKMDAFGEMDPEDFVRIRNLAGIFTGYFPKFMDRVFSDENSISVDMFNLSNKKAEGKDNVYKLLKHIKDRNDESGFILHKMTINNPVINYCTDKDHAILNGVSLLFDYEYKEDNNFTLIRSIAKIRIEVVKENQIWKIHSVELQPLLVINEEAIHVEKLMEPMPSRVAEYFPEMDINESQLTASDIYEIESILPEWTERLKRGDLEEFPGKYMVNDRHEISMSMRMLYEGYQAVYDRCRFLIKGVLGEYYHKGLRFPQFHSASSPVIAGDGVHSQGLWDDIAWGNIANAVKYIKEDSDVIEYFPGIGQYVLNFVKDKKGWRLYQLADRTINIPPIAPWSLQSKTSYGWCNKQIPEEWPLPFEKI